MQGLAVVPPWEHQIVTLVGQAPDMDAGGTATFFEGDVSAWDHMQAMAARAIDLHTDH